MPRGGYRPGAGRPKGGGKKAAAAPVAATPGVPRDIAEEAAAEGLSPLDYMLKVMNDANAEDARRDRMAIAAAPFVHGKPGEGGKKEQRQAAALEAEKSFAAPPAPPRLVASRA